MLHFNPAFLEVEANQNHINVRVFSEHSRPHWARGCGGAEAGGPWGRVYLFSYPPQAYLHAFVSAASFCAAAATGWDIPLAPSLPTDDLFVFSPILTPGLGHPSSSLLWVVRCQPDTALVSVLTMSLSQCLFSSWVNTRSAGFSVQSLYLPSIYQDMLMESGIESSWAPCLKLGQEVSKGFGSFVLMSLEWGKQT